MSLIELLKIGDPVVINVDSEHRRWTNTYNDIPDGTKGVVCGFYDAIHYESRVQVYTLLPGVYHSKGAPSVWLADGRVVPGSWVIEMMDKDEEKRRDAEMRDADGILQTEYTRLGDLPETKFWEGDKVRVNFPHDRDRGVMTISCIDYHFMHKKRNDGSPWPFYDMRLEQGGTMSAEESWITLIERGNVWKHYHNEPIVFADIKEEVGLAVTLGLTTEIQNPANDLFSWTKDEVLAAIQAGTVHGFSMPNGFFGSGPHIVARTFKDEELGRRVAKATLEGFGLS